jgi:hypothetical protein
MKRRDVLQAIGAATALSFIPRDARAVWARLAAPGQRSGGLTEAQYTLVTAIAETIIPRTDTPGATDVRVSDWVDLVVAEYYTDAERENFRTGLDAIDARAKEVGGVPFARLSPAQRDEVMGVLERTDRPQDLRVYPRLKALVVHGYFTSERVHKDVLKVRVMPGHFDGAAPMPAGARKGASHD